MSLIKEFNYSVNDTILNTFIGSKLDPEEIEEGMTILIQRDFDGASTVSFYRIVKINKINIKIRQCKCDGSYVTDRILTASKEHLYQYLPDE